ncbi:GNAT family N-acetyltransferase [Laceyella putida]|uniref:GNAT family N-acetyltransferase n=1 Tax=Laceyella putida TaxID=110101 RepID=A0ABW2RHQ6_9BACL
MIRIHPLSQCTWEEALRLWNEAFSGYFLDVSMAMETYLRKWVNESLSPELSLVAWIDEKPVGFVINGIRSINGKKVAWNGGTAIVPAWRGKGIGRKLMEEALVLYKREGVELATLEAIAVNQAAIRLYEKLGYRIVDRVSFYRSPESLTPIESTRSTYQIERIAPIQVSSLPFYRHEATWQTQWFCLRDGEAWVAKDDQGHVVGYALVRKMVDEQGKPQKAVLYQAEVEPGRTDERECIQCLLQTALGPVSASCERVIVNWPSTKRAGAELIKQLGFEVLVEQVQMAKEMAE